MSALAQQNISLELCDTIFKLLGITDENVSRFVLTVDFNEAPQIEITRAVLNATATDIERTTQRFRVEPMEEPHDVQYEQWQMNELSDRLERLMRTPALSFVKTPANPECVEREVAKLLAKDPPKEPYIGLDGGVK